LIPAGEGEKRIRRWVTKVTRAGERSSKPRLLAWCKEQAWKGPESCKSNKQEASKHEAKKQEAKKGNEARQEGSAMERCSIQPAVIELHGPLAHCCNHTLHTTVHQEAEHKKRKKGEGRREKERKEKMF